jgi:hypothetical protein
MLFFFWPLLVNHDDGKARSWVRPLETIWWLALTGLFFILIAAVLIPVAKKRIDARVAKRRVARRLAKRAKQPNKDKERPEVAATATLYTIRTAKRTNHDAGVKHDALAAFEKGRTERLAANAAIRQRLLENLAHLPVDATGNAEP